MYGLRTAGGNHFSYYAGQRGGFMVLRDPEFNAGRMGSERGVATSWDTTRCASRRANSVVINKIIASSREGDLRRTGQLPKSPSKPSSSLTRTMSCPSLGARRQGAMDSNGLDSFLDALQSPNALPAYSREGYSSNVTKHYRELRGQLSSLKERQLHDPEGLRRDLAAGATWKFWASSLKELQQRHIWGDDLPDGFPARGLAVPKGVGKWNYVHPNATPPISPSGQ